MGGQFYRKGQLPEEVAKTTLEQASAYELAWSFMGFSFLYILFIGLSQIIGAWLLLWNRTKLLGVAILLPILINIIVFDILFLDIKDALANAIIYFLMLLYILYFNKIKVTNAFNNLTATTSDKKVANPFKLQRLAAVLCIMALIFGIDQFFVNLIRSYYNTF